MRALSWWRACVLGCVLGGLLVCALGCERVRASRAQCELIFERLITLELAEMGFQDPALTARWVKRLRARYRAELDECVGRAIPPEAMRCLKEAKTIEVMSHECLR